MALKKKLQVFISSTYKDLQDERQAAVEAILAAGHIPAGMELFAAGNESQMKVIEDWIDESDVFMLILGCRYGSIEPKSEKSYVQIEYEYALKRSKPLFAVVIKDDYVDKWVKKKGGKVIEVEHPDKLRVFRDFVCTKTVKFWEDPKDVKIAIMETMVEMSKNPELLGWIPGDQIVSINPAMAEELANIIAKLIKENDLLRDQMSKLTSDVSSTIAASELKTFIEELIKVYGPIGGSAYISLETLKEKLSDKYSENEFDELLIIAREKYPDKIWIDKEVVKETGMSTTIIKIHHKSF
jgi:hypothetical protein